MSQLTHTFTDNGNTTNANWYGGTGTYAAKGNFGGGALELQYSLDGGTSFISGGVESQISAEGGKNFSLPKSLVRFTLSGATSPNLEIFLR